MKKNYLLFAFLFVIIIIAGCGSSKEQKEIAEEKPVQQLFKLEYKLKPGDLLNYKMKTNVKQIISMMGQEQVINISTSQNIIINVLEELSDGNYKVEFYSDSLTIDSDNPQISNMIGDFSYMVRKKCSAILQKNGVVKDITEIDKIEIPEKMKQLSDQFNPKKTFSKFLLVLPDEEIGIGYTWDEPKDDIVDNMGNKINVKSNANYRIAEIVKHQGFDVFKIASVLNLEMNGKGSQMGQEFNISGKGKADSEYFFAKDDGKLISYKVEQSNDTNAEIIGMGMTIPMTTITLTTLELVQ